MIAWQRFSNSAHLVLTKAQQEAQLRYAEIDLEHLLLAMLECPGGVGVILCEQGVDPCGWREHLPPPEPCSSEELLTDVSALGTSSFVGRPDVPLDGSECDLPLTSQSVTILVRADEEAALYGSQIIGSHHILLSLLRHSVAPTQWLREHDITYETMRSVIAESAYSESLQVASESHATAHQSPDPRLNLVSFLITPVFLSLGLLGSKVPELRILLIVPVLGFVVALGVMLLSKSERLKYAVYWYLGGFGAMGFALSLMLHLASYLGLLALR